jgi:hypothetical protein
MSINNPSVNGPLRPRAARLATLAACALLALAGTALGQTVTYQGRLEQAGSPVNQTRDLRFELFAAAQGGPALATVTASGVSVTNGLFTAPLSFPPGSFEGGPRFLQITLLPQTPGGASVTLPRQPVGSAPRAESVRGLAIDPAGRVGLGGPATADQLTLHGTLTLVGGAGIRFPDGTVQATAAPVPTPSVQVVYPPGTAPVVTLGSTVVTLAEPLVVRYEVVKSVQIGPPEFILTVPGRLTVSPVVIRRPLTGDAEWRDLYSAIVAGPASPSPANLRSLKIASTTPGAANDCTLTLNSLMAIGHSVVNIDGQAFEELRLNQTVLQAPVPQWPVGATGNGGTFTILSPLIPEVAGALLLNADVRSVRTIGEAVAVNGPNGTIFQFQNTFEPVFTLRTAFGSSPRLGQWLASVPTGATRQRAFSVLQDQTSFSISALNNSAWVSGYTLLPGPGGELIEEWTITSNYLR